MVTAVCKDTDENPKNVDRHPIDAPATTTTQKSASAGGLDLEAVKTSPPEILLVILNVQL